MQVALHYNIPTPTDSTKLSIQVKPEVDCNSNSLRHRVALKFQSQYHGKELTPNMIIVDLKMLSGFVPDPGSLWRYPSLFLTFNHTLDIIQELPVQNLKPTVVKIYNQPCKFMSNLPQKMQEDNYIHRGHTCNR
nr:murinoglobulin-2-like [Salvelinus alpinus]